MPASGFGPGFLARHPNLERAGFEVTSPSDENYNCVAWALGQTDVWYQPGGLKGTVWPIGLPADFSLASYVTFFSSFGFEVTNNTEYDQRTERLALYGIEGDFCHVARQTESGWTSKCGELQDITHASLQALEDAVYGRAEAILERVRPG